MSEVAAGAPAAAPAAPAGPPPATTANFRSVVAANVAANPAPAPKPAAPAAQSTPAQAAAEPAAAELEQPVETETTEPTAKEQETAEAVADLLDVDIHGKKGREILEAIQKGQLPDELISKLKRNAKVRGEDIEVTIEEAIKGYQRQSDYSRGKREAEAQSREARDMVQAVNDFIGGWKDGDTLLAGIRRLGKQDAFHAAAVKYARELHEEQQLKAKNPEAYEARKALEAERAARAEAERRAEEAARKQVSEQDLEARQKELLALTMPEFERLRIRDTPFARAKFVEHFQALYRDGADLAELVRDAAQATQEDLVDLAARFKKESDAADTAAKPKLPPVAKTQAAPAPKDGFGGKKSMSTAEFAQQRRDRMRAAR